MFTLPSLPYAESALEPAISANTLRFHHGKHHKAYVDKLNDLVKGTVLESAPLETIIAVTAGKAGNEALFDNAAQTFNHNFYWNSLTGRGGGKPRGRLLQMFDSDLGGYDGFRKAFVAACVGQFGSGWGWLVVADGKLKVISTGNAAVSLTKGQTPLLAVDVWEHAYYLDYQNRRPEYVNAVLDNLLNWGFAERNLERILTTA
jgi:Fe-Mn family superoxide dismutase